MKLVIDANEAVARIAYKLNEVIAIYPITPASPMAELCDLYASHHEKNILGTVPEVVEMQSEGGASGTVHGALQSGSLTTTFTASQGLLLMLPNMYKIAGELTPTVIHVAARSLAAQALSIFADHSDVMSARQTGFAMLASASVQEAHDFALISQIASMWSRIPFMHFFDGFRTSHEVDKIEALDDEVLQHFMTPKLLEAFRKRALTPDHPFIRGTSQNPDVFFQGRESVNRFYDHTPDIVAEVMEEFKTLTGRGYQPFEYVGAKDAKQVIIAMASATQTIEESVKYLNRIGHKVGLIKVKLYRPFSLHHFISVLPSHVQAIAVLDRTKEAGSVGEPLYLDIVSSVTEAYDNGELPQLPRMIGGRYGLSSKEFTPAMVNAIYEELTKEQPKRHFTIGIDDDITHTSLEYDKNFVLPHPGVYEAMFFGLGLDGTVGANKNSIKIIGEHSDNYAQGYFVYDSKKSGAMTVSHLRFGGHEINMPYLIEKADFVACHQSVFMEKFDILSHAKEGAIFLLNSPIDPERIWDTLPKTIQEEIIAKQITFYIIDAYTIAKKFGLGRRINTIMQTCFFAISKILPEAKMLEEIKASIHKTYGKKSQAIVEQNLQAVDETLHNLFPVDTSRGVTSRREFIPAIHGTTNAFVANVTAHIIEGRGDELKVSQIPADGTWESGTTQYEKRNIALEVPFWNPDICIECNTCVTVCPHAVIRSKVVDDTLLDQAPQNFKSKPSKTKKFKPENFTLQIAIEDCTGCAVCVEECPVTDKTDPSKKAITMVDKLPILEEGIAHWDYFRQLPNYDRDKLDHSKMKEAQILEPLFEFSGACAGCGETPYLKLLTQLFGDRMMVANATGCSSIYGGNLPTTPWTKNSDGRGPAWSNSLFEDNAEFGLGFRISIDKKREEAEELLSQLAGQLDKELVQAIIETQQTEEPEINVQRQRVEELKSVLEAIDDPNAKTLLTLADYLVKKSVWIVGGDGWAYDIDYGGVDHVLASGKNVNILVLDTQVYSNTGGQQSKATFTGAVAKFAAGGKPQLPKDLAMMAIAYGNVYVARVAMGANDAQTLKALREAEAYEGVSIIIAYAHCIAHGYDMRYGMKQQQKAVECGLWPLIRYNPMLPNPMSLDYKEPKLDVKEYMYNEARFKMVDAMDHETAEVYLETARHHAQTMYHNYSRLVE